MLEAATPSLKPTALVHPAAQRAIVSLSAFKGQGAALGDALGVALPSTPRRIRHNGADYLWAGPNAWLVISENPALFDELATVVAPFAAITDQSDGHCILRVIGPRSRALLAKLVPVDLYERSFAPDAVALTLAAHIGVKLWQEEDGAFALACFRSFAGALHHALLEAADEFETSPDRG
jgi:heterotetrameric sarcosine oxidase gamma subunit